jgi:hypothetical protein
MVIIIKYLSDMSLLSKIIFILNWFFMILYIYVCWIFCKPLSLYDIVDFCNKNSYEISEEFQINDIKILYYFGFINKKSIVDAFILSCECGNLELAKCIVDINENNKKNEYYQKNLINVNNELAFRQSCKFGRIDIAKWLYSLGVNIHVDDNYVFYQSCISNDLKMIRWLNSLSIVMQYDLFRISLMEGSLDVAKWLYNNSYFDKNRIRDNNDILFKICCSLNKINTIQWLETIYYCYDHRLVCVNDKLIIKPIIIDQYFIIDGIIPYNCFNSTKKMLIDQCVICLESYKYFVMMKCSHLVCIKCFMKIYKCYYRCDCNLDKFSDHTLIENF